MTKRVQNIAAIVSYFEGICNLDTCDIEENCGTLWVDTDDGSLAVSAIHTDGECEEK